MNMEQQDERFGVSSPPFRSPDSVLSSAAAGLEESGSTNSMNDDGDHSSNSSSSHNSYHHHHHQDVVVEDQLNDKNATTTQDKDDENNNKKHNPQQQQEHHHKRPLWMVLSSSSSSSSNSNPKDDPLSSSSSVEEGDETCESSPLVSPHKKPFRVYEEEEEDQVCCPEQEEKVKEVKESPPLASTLKEFHYHSTYLRPRPEWLNGRVTFGTDGDSALHACIRSGYTQGALGLMEYYLDLHNQKQQDSKHKTFLLPPKPVFDMVNSKLVTPLILASQKGNLTIVKALLSTTNKRLHDHHQQEDGNGNKRAALPLASVAHVTMNGTTALLQAAHFGHLEIVKVLLKHHFALLEMANFKHTTPLMRASQEGHFHVVQYLVSRGALVNRKNASHMTALMLASQRGHAQICDYLIRVGHANINAQTSTTVPTLPLSSSSLSLFHNRHYRRRQLHNHQQYPSTALILAAKRNHYDTVKVLVTAGSELYVPRNNNNTGAQGEDDHHDNDNDDEDNDGQDWMDHHHYQQHQPPPPLQLSVQAIAHQRGHDRIAKELLMDPHLQVMFMRQDAKKQQSWAILRMWTLWQQQRATWRENTVLTLNITSKTSNLSLSSSSSSSSTDDDDNNNNNGSSSTSISTMALMGCMTMLPAPLLQHVVEYIPYPYLWEQRLQLLRNRAPLHANSALCSCLDVMDEILEESGLVSALDETNTTTTQNNRTTTMMMMVPPPPYFSSWSAWKGWCRRNASELVPPTLIVKEESIFQQQQQNARDHYYSLGRHIPQQEEDTTQIRIMRSTRANHNDMLVDGGDDVVVAVDNNHKESSHRPLSLVQLRRRQGYLGLLATHQHVLVPVLTAAPYEMPYELIQELVTSFDVYSLIRRMALYHHHNDRNAHFVQFPPPVALDMITLTTRLCHWQRHHHGSSWNNNNREREGLLFDY